MGTILEYWATSVFYLLLLFIIPISYASYQVNGFFASLSFPIVIGLVCVLLAFPLSQWRLEWSLESLFKDTFRYDVVDYDRAVIDKINIYTLKPSDLNHIVNKYHDACVEAFVNLPNKIGGMTGFKWYSYLFYYESNADSVGDWFNLEKFWKISKINEGRCIKPSLYYK